MNNIYTYNFYTFFIAFVIVLVASVPKLGTVSVQTVVMALGIIAICLIAV